MTRDNALFNKNRETNDLRTDRITDRESVKEVIMPDGTKLIRRPTEKLGRREGKLAITPKEGFERRWVKNETQGNLQRYIDLGWIPATDKHGRSIEPMRGGVRKNGTEYKLYPLEIPTKELERLIKQNEIQDPVQQALKNQKKWLEGQQVEGLTYNPDGSINSIKEVDVKSPSKT